MTLQVTFLPLVTRLGHLTLTFGAFESVAVPAARAIAAQASTEIAATTVMVGTRRDGLSLCIVASLDRFPIRGHYPLGSPIPPRSGLRSASSSTRRGSGSSSSIRTAVPGQA